jgi:hypothetical protein
MASRLQLKYGLVSEQDRLSELGRRAARHRADDRLEGTYQGQPVRHRHRPHAAGRRATRASWSPTSSGASTTTTSRRASRSCLEKADPQRQPPAAPRARGQRPRAGLAGRGSPSCAATSCTSHVPATPRLPRPRRPPADARARPGRGPAADDNLRVDVWRGDFASAIRSCCARATWSRWSAPKSSRTPS